MCILLQRHIPGEMVARFRMGHRIRRNPYPPFVKQVPPEPRLLLIISKVKSSDSFALEFLLLSNSHKGHCLPMSFT
ncbi:hypothetical protein CC2G_013993 [Coprinopsis cinerea AmutBmut pab1-1]|nr:hypothetical protein CC2G_013993 [Coprinopsis cinerea AmutBmut pab1-1]